MPSALNGWPFVVDVEVVSWSMLGPRDVHGGRRLGATMLVAPSVLLAVMGLVDLVSGKPWAFNGDVGEGTGSIVQAVIIPAVLLALAWGLRFGPNVFFLVASWGLPLGGAAILLYLGLIQKDSSVGLQVFFVLPVLFAASCMKTLASWVLTILLAAHAWVLVFLIEPLTVAISDSVIMTFVLSAMTWSISHIRDAQGRMEAELRKSMLTDALTGLATRLPLDARVETSALRSSAKTGDALLIVDVDHFKTVNDTYGHPAGDTVLQHVADLLTRHAGPSDMVSRLGGDELAVLLSGCTIEQAYDRASRLVDVVRKTPVSVDDQTQLHVTISVGAAHVLQSVARSESLYASADAALYAAKRAGRDQVGTLESAQ